MRITINLVKLAKWGPFACIIMLMYPLWDLPTYKVFIAYAIMLLAFACAFVDGGNVMLEHVAVWLKQELEAEKERLE